MIFDGINGYVKGNLDQPVGTILVTSKGPIAGKNWHNDDFYPTYSITISNGASGAIVLEGTNDAVYAANPDASSDLQPPDNASWSPIQAGTSVSANGTITTSYYFLRLRITTRGAGTVTNAWIAWN